MKATQLGVGVENGTWHGLPAAGPWVQLRRRAAGKRPSAAEAECSLTSAWYTVDKSALPPRGAGAGQLLLMGTLRRQ